jgi:hypothetical protein
MMRSILSKTKLFALVLGAMFALSGATVVSANGWDHDCGRRIQHEQEKLDRAVARHGYHSWQADHDRRVLHDLYVECR